MVSAEPALPLRAGSWHWGKKATVGSLSLDSGGHCSPAQGRPSINLTTRWQIAVLEKHSKAHSACVHEDGMSLGAFLSWALKNCRPPAAPWTPGVGRQPLSPPTAARDTSCPTPARPILVHFRVGLACSRWPGSTPGHPPDRLQLPSTCEVTVAQGQPSRRAAMSPGSGCDTSFHHS
jgi:hypothetical protein